MNYLSKAKEIFPLLVDHRRAIHSYGEIGFEFTKTLNYIKTELENIGVESYPCGKGGLYALIGKGEPCVLLRADIDALPMEEKTGLEYACTTGGTHSCGHDCHGAMLLGAAKLLKENEANLKGTVKLMFQPAEEILAGAQDMIDNGILQNPTVNAAFATHVMSGQKGSKVGNVFYSKGAALYSGDAITIEVTGKESHGSASYMGIDAINIAAHIVVALNEIISREIPLDEHSVVLVGKISGGLTVNTTPGSAVLEVSVREQTQEKRDFLKQRVKEISEGIATTFRGKAKVNFVYGMAPLVCDETLATKADEYCKQMGLNTVCVPTAGGTEDFTAIANIVPSVMLNLGAGALEDGYTYGMHNPAMTIDENVLPIGTAVYAQCATEYLNNY